MTKRNLVNCSQSLLIFILMIISLFEDLTSAVSLKIIPSKNSVSQYLSEALFLRLGISEASRMEDDVDDRWADRVPAYMHQLYHRHQKNWQQFDIQFGKTRKNLGAVTSIHSHPIFDFKDHNISKETALIYSRILIFNLSDTLRETINHQHLAAELRFFHLQLPTVQTNNLNINLLDDPQIRVDVYNIYKTSDEVDQQTAHIQGHTIKVDADEWISFDVSKSLQNAKHKGDFLVRFLVEVTQLEGNFSKMLRQHEHIRTKRSVEPSEDPHLVTYHRDTLIFSDTTPSGNRSKNKQRRQRRRRRRKNRRRNRGKKATRVGQVSSNQNDLNKRRIKHQKRDIYYQRHQRRIRRNCRRRSLLVDFLKINWRWILAPNGYDAGYCAGTCPFPLSDNFNATNHAIVQLLVHEIRKDSVPGPCCVPLKLSSQSLLYRKGNDVILKVFQDMAVEHCGCR